MAKVAKGEAVEVECPYCGRPLFAISESQQILHSRPACLDFEAKTAKEIVAAVSAANVRN